MLSGKTTLLPRADRCAALDSSKSDAVDFWPMERAKKTPGFLKALGLRMRTLDEGKEVR